MGYNIFIKTLACKSFTLSLDRTGSETTGLQIKKLLSNKEEFKDENIIDEYVLIFNGSFFANSHHLYDHQVTSDSTINIIKIDNNIKNTLIAQYNKNELLAKQPSLRVTHLICGYIRNEVRKETNTEMIEFSMDLCKYMVKYLGNKFPTFEISIYDKIYKISEKWLVKNLKRKLNNAPYHNIKYESKTLKNYHTFEYYNITYNNKKMHKLKYFCHQLYLKQSNGKLITLDLLTLNLTLLQGKQAVFEQHNISVKSQKWILNGKVLKNKRNLKSYYGIQRETVINLILTKQRKG
eukprot:504516_1